MSYSAFVLRSLVSATSFTASQASRSLCSLFLQEPAPDPSHAAFTRTDAIAGRPTNPPIAT